MLRCAHFAPPMRLGGRQAIIAPHASSSGSENLIESSSLESQNSQNGLGYTVSSLYIKKRDMPSFVQIDHLNKRKKRDVDDIIEVRRHDLVAQTAHWGMGDAAMQLSLGHGLNF